ncbi:unnamed protein product [Moneuplotes crassus]|uniref:PDEase domain-containing protein n=1 Tax=Euplotes crassus TaxID=5936 RepID=A0AAD1U609_EUPCR|nr:unnamed protein product [Moneuplotes crassus]
MESTVEKTDSLPKEIGQLKEEKGVIGMNDEGLRRGRSQAEQEQKEFGMKRGVKEKRNGEDEDGKKEGGVCGDAKGLRMVHCVFELAYCALALSYFYSIMEIKEEESVRLIAPMMYALCACLLMYLITLMLVCRSLGIIIDILLLILAISTNFYEIQIKYQIPGYQEAINHDFLNISRVLKIIMIQRNASNFLHKAGIILNSRDKGLSRKETVTDMISEIINYLAKTNREFLNKRNIEVITEGLYYAYGLSSFQEAQNSKRPRLTEEDSEYGYRHYEILEEEENLEQDNQVQLKINQYKEDLTDEVVDSLLKKISDFDFDIFQLKEATKENELVTIINYLFEANNFYEKIGIIKEKFQYYSVVIQELYNPVPYHNKTHASDVCQSCYYFIQTLGFREKGNLSAMEECSILLASFIHDSDHPGYNNLYMIRTRDKLAIRYNDKSVLENHHISVAFSAMMKSPKTRFNENLSNGEFDTMRSQIIDLVLATDNSTHFSEISHLRTRLDSEDFDPSGEDKAKICNYLIHIADISNPSKPWKICQQWADLLCTEFFFQGDKEREKGIPISFLMDRYTTNVASGQIGFIDNFLVPAFNILVKLLPEFEQNNEQMRENKKQWKSLEKDLCPEKNTQKCKKS